MNTHDKIELPPPHGYVYVWDGPCGTHRLTAGQYNGRQCDRTVAYYTEGQVRAAIEADRKQYPEEIQAHQKHISSLQQLIADLTEKLQQRRGSIVNNASASSEPVAWLVRDDMLGTWLFRSEKPEPGLWKYVKPLYDTPQPAEPCVAPTLHNADSAAQNRIQATQPLSESDIFVELVGDMSAGQLDEILTTYIKPEIIREALEKLENAPWELSDPVKVDTEASVPSDTDIDELSREWGLLSAAYPSKSMVRDFARALLARYG